MDYSTIQDWEEVITLPLPTFIIGGAAKCGSTALWGYLDEHPEVCMSRIKEPVFFTQIVDEPDKGIIKPGVKGVATFKKGLDEYLKLFATCDQARAIGEASTHYFSAPDSAVLIKKFIPEVRLIFLLRDPVERLYSHYWEDYKGGWNFPPFEKMVKDNHLALSYYCYVSHYKNHLERFFSYLSEEQVLVLLHTDLKEHPQETFQKVCQFIDVNPGFNPPSLGKTFNQYTVPKIRWLEKVSNVAKSSQFAHTLPVNIRRYFGSASRFMSKLNSVPNHYPKMSSDTRAELVERYEDDISYVEELLARDLSSWRKF